MSKQKVIMLIVPFVLASCTLACNSSGVGEKSGAPANNASASNTKPTNAATPAPTTPVAAGIPADVEPIFAAKCAMCHGKDAKGQGNAPSIFDVKDKHTSEQWAAYLKDPKSEDKDSKMPPVQLSADESKKVSDWLAATTGKAGGAAPAPADEKKDAKSEGMKKP